MTGAVQVTTGVATVSETWPNLPVALKSGIGVHVGNTAYVGLGTAGTGLYALDLTNPVNGWARCAPFIGPVTYGAAAAASGTHILIFSGNGKKDEAAKSPIIFDAVYAYDTERDAWTKLDTTTPAGLLGAKAVALSDGRIGLIGGFNKELFDRYLADLSDVDKEREPARFNELVNGYMNMRPLEYRWNDEFLTYDPTQNTWGTLGKNPYLPNCDAALIVQRDDRFIIASGEIKPGLRTPEVKAVEVKGQIASWHKLPDLPAISGSEQQEGLAGAYAGLVGDDVLLAGGANFKGSRANAAMGNWYAHHGLTKSWRNEVYVLSDRTWTQVGKLPIGLAYGAAIAVSGGLLLVGGEDGEGKARTDVFLLKWDGQHLSVRAWPIDATGDIRYR
ncbi:N-acetylneuraminate epimerase [Agrobacterium sp. 22-210-1]